MTNLISKNESGPGMRAVTDACTAASGARTLGVCVLENGMGCTMTAGVFCKCGAVDAMTNGQICT